MSLEQMINNTCAPQNSRQPSWMRAFAAGENATDLYPWTLYSLYKGYRIYDPNLSAYSDVDAYNQVLLDSTARRSIEMFLRGVTSPQHFFQAVRPSKNLQIRALEQRAIDLYEDFYSYIDNELEFRQNLASGLIRGRSYAQIIWKKKWCKLGGIFGEWKIPILIQDEDQARYQYFITRIPNGPVAGELRRFNLDKGEWIPLNKYEQKNFIQFVNHNVEDRFGYGDNLLSIMLELLWIKTNALKSGLQGLEMYTKGILHFASDQLLTDQKNHATTGLENDWHNAYEGILAGRGYIITSLQDQIKVIQGNAVDNTFMEVVKYCNEELLKLPGNVLSLSSDEAHHGSYAKSETEEAFYEVALAHPRALIDQAISRDLLGWFKWANYSLLHSANLADVRLKFVTGKERMIDVKEQLDWAKSLQSLGYHLDPSEVFEHTGFTVQAIDLQSTGDQLPGGLADQKINEDFDPAALKKGTKVEMEHTNDPAIAEEIARDYLSEDDQYYEKLATIEKPTKDQPSEKFWKIKGTDPAWMNLIIDDTTRDYLQQEKQLIEKDQFKKLSYRPAKYCSKKQIPILQTQQAAVTLPEQLWEENRELFGKFETEEKVRLDQPIGPIEHIGYYNRNLFLKFKDNPFYYHFKQIERKQYQEILNNPEQMELKWHESV